MKAVTDSRGSIWICLELPDPPAGGPPGHVEIECNDGAERVRIVLPSGWDAGDDGAVVRAIEAERRPG
jgi:hypothetical protein